MEYSALPGSERFLRNAGRIMGASLLLFVGFNAYSSVYDAKLQKDSSALKLSIATRKADRQTAENAVLLRQRERWLQQGEDTQPSVERV
jgi:hypothetical protein